MKMVHSIATLHHLYNSDLTLSSQQKSILQNLYGLRCGWDIVGNCFISNSVSELVMGRKKDSLIPTRKLANVLTKCSSLIISQYQRTYFFLETTVLDHGRGQELLVKEALHIQMAPSEECFNWDGGLEVPSCWTAVMRSQGGRSTPHRPLTSNDVYPQQCMAINVCSHFFTFALTTTGAFSRNVGKLFSELKLLKKKSLLFV